MESLIYINSLLHLKNDNLPSELLMSSAYCLNTRDLELIINSCRQSFKNVQSKNVW